MKTKTETTSRFDRDDDDDDDDDDGIDDRRRRQRRPFNDEGRTTSTTRQIVGDAHRHRRHRDWRKDGSLCLRRFGRSAKILAKTTVGASSSDDAGKKDEGRYDFIEDITDENVLTTSLNRAISDEDYSLASKLSKRLQVVQNVNGGRDAREILLDWRMLGIAEWMASRAEALGFGFQPGFRGKRRAMLDGDRLIVISAQTGTGKTLAYLVPALDQMDFVGRQMLQILVVVPSRELVVQTTMLAYKLTWRVNFERRAWRWGICSTISGRKG